jgi:chitinase
VTHRARLLILSSMVCGGAACDSPVQVSDPTEQAAVDCSRASPWVVGRSYPVGAAVTFEGSVYQCIQAHTSQADWSPPVVPALWGLTTCGGGGGRDAGVDSGGGGGVDAGGGSDGGGGGGGGGTADGFVFGPYKDALINMNFNTNVISTMVTGTRTPIANAMTAVGEDTITLSFATGQCGTENWGGVPGPAMASANVPLLTSAGIKYILSTGGAAGSFRCDSDSGFATFINRWVSPNLIGIDFDIETGQSPTDILNLVRRIPAAHARHPGLRFSLTIATLANTEPGESLNPTGVATVQAVKSVFSTLPSYVTINLMTMNYGAPSPFVCVVRNGACDMGQSAIQAVRNLSTRHGIAFGNIEITPMIGGNDVQSNVFRLPDVDTVGAFARQSRIAGVHYWSYDRDVDCPPGSASPICNSLGGVGPHGFLRRFQGAGL